MKSVSEMSNAELVAEAERREVRRRAGVPLGPPGAAVPARKCAHCRTPLAMVDDTCPRCGLEPLEEDEQAEVVKLYRAFGCMVYTTSQRRQAKVTPGIPDLLVFHDDAHRMWYHETKRAKSGRLSTAQQEFRDHCRMTRTDHVVGGLAVARTQLVVIGLARFVVDTPHAAVTSVTRIEPL